MKLRPSSIGSFQWIFYLTTGLLFGAVGFRSLLVYANSSILPQVLGFVLLALLLFILSETSVSARWSGFFPLYLFAQTIVVLILLFMPGFPDFYAVLFAMPSMQIMQRSSTRVGVLCIGLFAILMISPLSRTYGMANGVSFALVYTFGNGLLASCALATRRAQAVLMHNEMLARELELANRQLQTYTRQVEQLAMVRERHRLTRELHDSVTQTIFSMTLSTQSALLVLERDPSHVEAQIERLHQLAQSALSEMHILISELRPRMVGEGGLVAALREHLASRDIPEGLSISLQVDGDDSLDSTEEQSLFRIAQEALNNIIKHARASQACIRLHLTEPFWMEIEDQGRGFDSRHMQNGGAGLVNMRERAAEIGWHLEIATTPNMGTRVRVEKRQA